ncbi:HAMP domain-containing protein [Bacillus licheniformis]|nr:HAMP domain-containing protein [Bacillus licheniformis]
MSCCSEWSWPISRFLHREADQAADEGFRKIADGDLSADISVKSRDEAGKLAESFKRMSEIYNN